jgi:hypothetical protein
MTKTWNVMQYCHIHKTKGSYDNLLIWQAYIFIKYHNKYAVAPNYNDFNDEGIFFVTRLGHLLESHNEN